MMLTAERLRQVMTYDQATGIFTRRIKTARVDVGDVAGSRDRRGYVCIRVDGPIYKAHRLAWLYVTGSWPTLEIDHVNGVTGDNRWANLREATRSQNMANARKHKNSWLKGARYHRAVKRWQGIIQKDGVRHELGWFDTPEEAHVAYCTAAIRLHGEFARAA